MTDKEVQRLGRRELLGFLLEAREENDALLLERDELRQARDTLQQERDDLFAEVQKLRSGSESPTYSPEDINERAAVLLQEARAAADEVMESRRGQQEAKEQHLMEWERRLKDREIQLNDQEQRLSEQRENLDQLSQKLLAEAHNAAMLLRKQAEDESAEILKSARSAAALTEKDAVDQAELLLRRAQEDSDGFWQDVSALLQKKLDAMEED